MEMLELAAELKWCRERIAALEAEQAKLEAMLNSVLFFVTSSNETKEEALARLRQIIKSHRGA